VKTTIKNVRWCRDPATGKAYPRGTCPKLPKPVEPGAQRKGKPHGVWHWRVRVPLELVALIGKEVVQGTEDTKTAAELAAEQAIADIRAGQQHTGSLSVGQYLDQWLQGWRRLRPTTRRSYEGHVRLHLKPWLGDIPLSGLRSHHIATAYQRIEAAGAGKSRPTGPATIARIHGTLKNALSDAVGQRLVPFSAAVGVELPA
jgi:hypothetical protein